MLKEIRESQGRTKQAVMKNVGVSAPTYDKYEANPSNIPVGQAAKLAAFLGVSITAIFTPGKLN